MWGIGCLDTAENNSNLNLTPERRIEKETQKERKRETRQRLRVKRHGSYS